MRIHFHRTVRQTGQSGEISALDRRIVRAMQNDKDIVGDIVGSSSSGIEVRGMLPIDCIARH